jgi:hypothetical protein
MILKISFNPGQLLETEKGHIILQMDEIHQVGTALNLRTVKGQTLEDFKKNELRSEKLLFVGLKGGIKIH